MFIAFFLKTRDFFLKSSTKKTVMKQQNNQNKKRLMKFVLEIA